MTFYLPLRIVRPCLFSPKPRLAPRPDVCRRNLCRYQSQRVLRDHCSSRPARVRVFFTPRATCFFASAMTTDATIDFETDAKLSFELPASPLSYSRLNTSRLQWPTSQTCVMYSELAIIESSQPYVTIDPRNGPCHSPEFSSIHYSPQPPPARTHQTTLEQTHISLMNDAIAIVVQTNLYTVKYNGVCIDLARRIFVVEKHRTLYNVQVDVSAPSVLSTLFNDRSICADNIRMLQRYANVVAILSERLKTRLCVF